MSRREGSLSVSDPKARRLEGKTALVTAGTAGIGRATVERLLQEGAKVFLCSRRLSNVEETVADLHSKGLKAVAGVACNVGKDEELSHFVEQGRQFLGDRFDVVIANAAVNPAAGSTLDMPDSTFDKIMSINVKSVWQLVKMVHPNLVSGSSVVLVSSVAGVQPAPPLGLYGVSKAAMVALGRVLAQDLGSEGIRVNTVCPGIVRTKFSSVFWDNDDKGMEERSSFLQRFADPFEIAAVVAFLASEDSAFMTGESVVCSGGSSSRM